MSSTNPLLVRITLLFLVVSIAAHAAIGTPVALTSKAFGSTSTVSQSVTLTTGDLFVVAFNFDSSRTLTSCKWNTIAMTQDVLVTYNTSSKLAICSLYITSGATATYDIVVSGAANGIANPMRVTGIATTSWTDKTASVATASTASPSSGATTTLAQAAELAIGVMARVGSTVGGSWSNSYTELATVATGANGVVDIGYLTTAATTAQTAAKTGATTSIYGAAGVTYLGNNSVAKTCTISILGAGVC